MRRLGSDSPRLWPGRRGRDRGGCAPVSRPERSAEPEYGGGEDERQADYPVTPLATQVSTSASSWSEAWCGYTRALPITSAACA